MTMLAPGSMVQERYRVERLIGQGGFGAVYEAVDERLGRRVALKQLLRISDRISRQFEREARLLANLEHPSLPSVIDHFSTSDGQYLVMQFVRGTDLADQLAQRGAPYSLEQVLAWGDQVLDVLMYLHALQPPIVHRDIKPQNIKLKSDGTIMLLDFGLAKGFAGESPPSSTEGSLLAYTKGYAPPEQIEGTGTDERSDLYALGATLHCLLTNLLPVEAAMRLLADARGRPDPLRPAHELVPGVPVAVSQVLQQALQLEPERRPASARDMRAMLRAAAGDAVPAPLPLPDGRAAQPPVRTGGATDAGATQQPFSRPGAPPTAVPLDQPQRPAASTALPDPPAERQPNRPPQPPTGSEPTIRPDAQRTTVPPARATPATQEHATIDRATTIPPAPPVQPPGGVSVGRQPRRPARTAIILGGALLALCLSGAVVGRAMGWFGGSVEGGGNPSPAASVIVLIPSPAASVAAATTGPVATVPPVPSSQAPTATGAPPAASARPDALISSTRLNLRAGPGEVYAIKASYSEGTPLRVMGKHAGSSWLYVQVPDGNDGWMHADFLLVNIPLANVAIATPPPAPQPQATPAPASPAADTVTSAPAASGEDWARIISIWPAPGTSLDAGQPQEFQIKLEYSLQSAEQAIAVLFMEQFPAGAGGCVGSQHRSNGNAQVPIQRGQGIATVAVTWNGGADSGFVSPGVNFWTDAGGRAARPLISGFGVFDEPCYPYGE